MESILNNFNKQINNWSNLKYFLTLFVFYSIAHGGILLIPNAIYWDDWTLYQVTPSDIYKTFKQAGTMFNLGGALHVAFLTIGPWFYKILTFILMFGAGIALNTILARHEKISIETRYLIVLFFLILPFNWARVALIDMPYTICYFSFFLAWAMMVKNRPASLILFFLSFNTNSLLAFYVLPFLDMYCMHNSYFRIKNVIYFCINKIDFLMLPFVYFIIKNIFYKPYGLYAGYNEQFSFGNLIPSIKSQILELFTVKINLEFTIFITIIVCICLFCLFDKKTFFRYKHSSYLISLGFLAVILACFPYWILGHVPTFHEWTSRHQLLMPLGGALVIVGVFYLLKGNLIVLSVILSFLISLNIVTYKNFYFDWAKQKSLMELFSKKNEIKEANIIVFNDKTKNINALSRTYRFYEWNGLLANSFGDEKKIGLEESGFKLLIDGKFEKSWVGKSYKSGDYSFSAPINAIRVEIKEMTVVPAYGLVNAFVQLIGLYKPRFELISTPLSVKKIQFKE